jgi:hypothetical protein
VANAQRVGPSACMAPAEVAFPARQPRSLPGLAM